MQRLVTVLAILSAAAVLAAAGWVVNDARTGGSRPPAVATVDRGHDVMSWRPARGGAWQPASPGQPLAAGDRLRTSGGRAIVHEGTGPALHLAPGTRLVVAAPGTDAGGNPVVPVALSAGAVTGVIRAGPARPSVEIRRTSGALLGRLSTTATAPTTRFRVRAHRGGTAVAILSGRATLHAGSHALTLTAGQAAELPGGEAGPTVVQLPPAPASQAPAVDARLARPRGKTAVTLTWAAIPEAHAYHLEVDEIGALAQLVVDRRTSAPHFAFRPPDTGTFTWRVAAIDAAGHEGAFGAIRRFTVVPPAGARGATAGAAQKGKAEAPLPPLPLSHRARGIPAVAIGRGLTRQPGGHGAPLPIRGRVRLAPHDVLSADQSAGLRVGRSLVLGLEEGCRLEVEGTGRDKAGPFLALRLLDGAVTGDLGSRAVPAILYLETAHTRVTLTAGHAGGTRVRASALGGTLRIVTERGTAKVLSGARKLALAEGNGLPIPDGSPPGPVATLPVAPPLVSPRPGARFASHGSPPAIELKWAPVEGAIGYQVRISYDREGTSVAYQGLSQSTELVDNGLAPGTYFWTVRALDPRGFSSAAAPARRLVVTRGAAIAALPPSATTGTATAGQPGPAAAKPAASGTAAAAPPKPAPAKPAAAPPKPAPAKPAAAPPKPAAAPARSPATTP